MNDDIFHDPDIWKKEDKKQPKEQYDWYDKEEFLTQADKPATPKKKKSGCAKWLLILTAVLLILSFVVGILGCGGLGLIGTLFAGSTDASQPAGNYGSGIFDFLTLPSQQQTSGTAAAELPDYDVEVRYWGQMLSPENQRVYQHLVSHFMEHQSTVSRFRMGDIDDLEIIVEMICNDYEEIFWYNGAYSSTYYEYSGYVEVEMTPQYVWDKETSQAYQAEIEAKTAGILQQLSGYSEYDKVKGVYEYLVDNTIYDLDYMNTTMYELFHYGRAVCEGYARATSYLLRKLGVEVIYVDGEGGHGNDWELHAWNVVKVDGAYYLLDVTWGDPCYDDGTQVKIFDYLCITTEEAKREHRTDWSKIPECTATESNYYFRENRVLYSYDEQVIKQWFVAGSSSCMIEFKCADAAIYQTAKNYLENGDFGQMLYDAVGYSGEYYYEYSDDMWTIRMRW